MVPQEDVLIPTPSVGEIVSFSFESHARRDVPVRPKIYRIRTDVSWEDISWNLAHESRSLNGMMITSTLSLSPSIISPSVLLSFLLLLITSPNQ